MTALAARPRAMAIAGALTIAFSAILVKQAGVSPSTAAIFRCAYAVPVLGVLAWWEDGRQGARSGRDRAVAALAGVFFSADLICWHHAIEDVGAGLATVLGNLQVAFVPLVAWLALGERPAARILATLPLVFSGVVLVSGVLEDGAYGANPSQGVLYGLATGLAYTGFILLLRAGSGEQRRVAGPLFDATLRRRGRVGRGRGDHRRCRPRPVVAGPRVARHPGAELAGPRVAADLGLAAAPAGGPDLAAADDPARGAPSSSARCSSPRRRRVCSSSAWPRSSWGS